MDPGSVSPGIAPAAEAPALPELDGARCVHAAIETATCLTCVEACPRGAWRLDDAALEFAASRCDGCGLCRDVCAHRAVALRAWAEPTQWLLPLAERRCARCGVTYTAPTSAAGKHEHCWVCAAKQQPSRLYQVMA